MLSARRSPARTLRVGVVTTSPATDTLPVSTRRRASDQGTWTNVRTTPSSGRAWSSWGMTNERSGWDWVMEGRDSGEGGPGERTPGSAREERWNAIGGEAG